MKTAGEVHLHQDKNHNLIDGLLSSGLIKANTLIKESPPNEPNLKANIISPTIKSPKNPKVSTTKIISNNNNIHSRPVTPLQTPNQSTPTSKVTHKETHLKTENKPSVSPQSPTDPNTNFFKQSPNNQNQQSRLFILDQVSSERKFTGKRDAVLLYNEYHKYLESINLDNFDNKAEIAESIEITTFTLNKLIFHIRGYSEYYARLLNEIKTFFIQRVTQIPKIHDFFTNIINENKEQISQLETQCTQNVTEINNNKQTIDELQKQINESKDELTNTNTLLQETQEKLEEEIFSKDLVQNEINSLKFKLAKTEEEKNEALKRVQSTEHLLENAKEQSRGREDLLAKYETEGAGFRPQYLKASEEISKLKEKIKYLKELNANMVQKQITIDVEVQTDEITTTKSQNVKTRSRTNTLEKKTNISSDDLLANYKEMYRNISNEKLKTISEDAENKDLIKSKNLITNNKKINKKSFVHNSMKANSRKRKGSFRIKEANPLNASSSSLSSSENSITIVPPKEEETKIKEMLSNKTETETKPTENKTNINDNNDNANKAELKIEKSSNAINNNNKEKELPSDYKIDNSKIKPSQTLLNCILRLLPLNIDLVILSSPYQYIDTIVTNDKCVLKPYYWVISKIVDFFHSVVETESENNLNETVINLFKKKLKEMTKIESLAIRLFNDIIYSCNSYKTQSSIVDFFMKFIYQEYTIVDFYFVNAIFNLCFEYIYPKVSDVVDNPDILPMSPQFLIHVDVIKKISYEITNEDIEELKAQTINTVHNDLIDFFVFAKKLLSLFRIANQQFHEQVKNILLLIEWTPNADVTQIMFSEFFILIDPTFDTTKISSFWEKFKLENGFNNESNQVNMDVFFQVCMEQPELTNEILELPYQKAFKKQFSELSNPVRNLLIFLRKHFTSFVFQVLKIIPENLMKIALDVVKKIRDMLLKCEVAMAFAFYRHFLQLIDLKMAEEKPFVVFSPNISSESVEDLMSMIEIREKLAVSWLDRNDEKKPNK
ncbi:hypothetical protein GPJ56_001425 [Histomonas meleagridis]|uniref:uncharacterized protein n=1 Tax=Histomonas meleagridis TaxID=135588 RepID=UPI00355A3AB2|nr:hypothetical protein GPJ56_001425 [Histomonas meleagridis]KAH0798185.1 hypothetical protein GO595_009031 [Histomonas meleagridis]